MAARDQVGVGVVVELERVLPSCDLELDQLTGRLLIDNDRGAPGAAAPSRETWQPGPESRRASSFGFASKVKR
jgi:hypothetical protein